MENAESNGRSRRGFTELAIADAGNLIFGRAPRPVPCGLGLEIGAGAVHPEINFTLPPTLIEESTWPHIRATYDRLLDRLLARARDLGLTGLAVEFEHLPPMTVNAAWGGELTALIKSHLQRANEAWGLASALRVTIVDLRDEQRPPLRRRGPAWEKMLASLRACAAAGADVLSIESTGGKEVHDAALVRADLPGIAMSLGVLAPRDMAHVWDAIVGIAGEYNIVAGGDSACGFANTAMQLAGQRLLPDCLAALVRAMSAPRSLVAFERGAIGPSKDCAYEGPVLKAIAGCPISMEGRSATCAHLSPIGNVAAAAADLWSNESVPDVQLLSGPAPVASLESLAYDCRLFNSALDRGKEKMLRDLHVASDAPHSAQAALLGPQATIALGQSIVREAGAYRRAIAAGRTALVWLRESVGRGDLRLPPMERKWLERLETAFDALPQDAEALIEHTRSLYGQFYDPGEYGLT
jgi:methanol--5-hydroxybenzimidazolylcobamide Co-methyltransferase